MSMVSLKTMALMAASLRLAVPLMHWMLIVQFKVQLHAR
jgi:hypothetical protein